MIVYASPGDPTIAAQHQPALLLDYARSRDAAGPALLRETGLDSCELPAAGRSVSPLQYQQLLRNVLRELDSADTSFMLGQQMLPGHYGAVSQALLHARTLRQALQILCEFHVYICPLLRPRLRAEGPLAVLYWSASYGAPVLLPALVEMHMTALVSLCRWLSGERLPWRFCFNRASPRHVEQHQVHLGQDLRFNCHLDAMLIDAAWLDRPWPRGNAMAAAVALRSVEEAAQRQPAHGSLPDALYDYLLEHVRCAPTLEMSAAAFDISPATLKRHLLKLGTHFQAELDQVRTHVALYLFQTRRADNDTVAAYLGFHDATNFRRSFKRWTGQTPGLLREGLHGV
ncbi:AraC family transcriptional regulator [Oxalobacteraceae bacterium]|nr:AraC family transcriptional regulator [Oxalobacteraceae bacterium]